jgi:hypothetical protein
MMGNKHEKAFAPSIPTCAILTSFPVSASFRLHFSVVLSQPFPLA